MGDTTRVCTPGDHLHQSLMSAASASSDTEDQERKLDKQSDHFVGFNCDSIGIHPIPKARKHNTELFVAQLAESGHAKR